MKKTLKALALSAGLVGYFNAHAHNQDILDACPILADDTVKIKQVPSTFSRNKADWRSVTNFTSDFTSYSGFNAMSTLFWDNDGQTDKPDLIVFNSHGGDVLASLNLMDAMKLTDNTQALCANKISSAAMYSFASAKMRYAFESCHGVAHDIHSKFDGRSLDLEERVYQREKMKEDYKKIILHNTHIDEECYKELFSNSDIVLQADEMLKLGIADAILHPGGTMSVRSDNPKFKGSGRSSTLFSTPLFKP